MPATSCSTTCRRLRPPGSSPRTRSVRWANLMALRDDVNKALELARAEKIVGKPLDAKVTLYVADEAKAAWETVKDADLAAAVHRLRARSLRHSCRGLGRHRNARRDREGRSQRAGQVPALLDARRRRGFRRRAPRAVPALRRRYQGCGISAQTLPAGNCLW